MASGLVSTSAGIFTCAWVALARASMTLVSTFCSWAAKPLTVSTRFGIRSARRLYWLSTSDHLALAVCS